MLFELDDTKEIEWEFHVDNATSKDSQYDMIIGMDLMRSIGLDIKCSSDTIEWQGRTTPFKNRIQFHQQQQHERGREEELFESSALQESTNRRDRILDADYKKADLQQVVQDQAGHLSQTQQQALLALLKKYEYLFDGTLGTWQTQPVDIKVRKDATPVYSKPFPIPRSQEDTLKREVKRLVKLGVLRKINRSEWSSPSFIIPKKNNQVIKIIKI